MLDLFGSPVRAPTASPAGIKKTRFRCQYCGEGFFPKRTDRLHFCSRECAFESKKAAAADRKIARQEREVERRARIIAEAKSRHQAEQEQREARRARLRLRPCATCGDPVGIGVKALRARAYCSSRCTPSGMASRRANRKARKLKLRCIRVESFDPVEILKRDGWRCHICKVATPSRLRGTYKPNAPELDHIIPVAAGGDHSRVNTACICRRCNASKGSTPLGQLRLVG
jgi:5-methylcytosine-specific restriction endonuclease McrA